MHRRNCNRGRKYTLIIAFCVGLLVAFLAPTKLLVAILAIAVILLGIACARA